MHFFLPLCCLCCVVSNEASEQKTDRHLPAHWHSIRSNYLLFSSDQVSQSAALWHFQVDSRLWVVSLCTRQTLMDFFLILCEKEEVIRGDLHWISATRDGWGASLGRVLKVIKADLCSSHLFSWGDFYWVFCEIWWFFIQIRMKILLNNNFVIQQQLAVKCKKEQQSAIFMLILSIFSSISLQVILVISS